MDIIFFAEDGRQRLQFSLPRLAAVAAVAALGAAAVFYGGAKYGIDAVRVRPTGAVSLWHQDLALQRANVGAVIERTENDLNALALRLGQLQARADLIDALGSRLVGEAQIPADEIGFAETPATGSADPARVLDASGVARYKVADFLSELRHLEARLEDRQPKLEALSKALLYRDLRREIRPNGRPVERGWISSHYGHRLDPKTGKRMFHQGTDFAGARGSRILAAAAGVVTESGVRAGYGKTVKISHPEGFVTRYAHNAQNLVSVGQVVHKGAAVALMGSTGRTTGPHLHYEVQQNGKPVNPKKFIHSSH